jgi:hypothetical protein
MSLCIKCSPAVQEVPDLIPNWGALVPDALCRGCRRPWSSPYIVVTPTWCNSHTALRFKPPAPSHATEVLAPFSLSRYSDLHTSDQKYPCPSQTQPQSPIKSLQHCGLGGGGIFLQTLCLDKLCRFSLHIRNLRHQLDEHNFFVWITIRTVRKGWLRQSEISTYLYKNLSRD